MLKKILNMVVFLSTAIFLKASLGDQGVSMNLVRLPFGDSQLQAFDEHEQKEFVLKVSSFYSERLKKKGVEAPIDLVFVALMDIIQNHKAFGVSDHVAMQYLGSQMQYDMLGAQDSELLFVLRIKCSNPNLGREDFSGLSSKEIFKRRLAIFGEISGQIKEDFFEYTWANLVKQYDLEDFNQRLEQEAELLKNKKPISLNQNLLCFCHARAIYLVLLELCYQLKNKNNLSFSQALELLKRAEQKNADLANCKLYSSSVVHLKNLQNHQEFDLLIKAAQQEAEIVKDQKFNELKKFCAKNLRTVDAAQQNGSLMLLKKRLLREIGKHKASIHQKFFDLTCDVLFETYGHNDLLIDKMLKNDQKLFQKSGVIQGPVLSVMLTIYGRLVFVFEELQKRNIINNKESLVLIVKFLRQQNCQFLACDNLETNINLQYELLDNVLSFCPLNTSDCFEQIRKEQALKYEEQEKRKAILAEIEQMSAAHFAQQKVDLRRIERQKKRKEKELLEQQVTQTVHENLEIADGFTNDDFYSLNMNFFQKMELAQNNRRLLRFVEDIQDGIKVSDLAERDEKKDLVIHQKESLKDQKAQRRLAKKTSEFKVCSEEKYACYNPDLNKTIFEVSLLGKLYDHQKNISDLQTHFLEEKDELCAAEYADQKLKKRLLRTWQMNQNRMRELSKKQELEKQQQQSEFLQNSKVWHNPYAPKVLELRKTSQEYFDDMTKSSSAEDKFPTQVVAMPKAQTDYSLRQNNPYAWSVLANYNKGESYGN